MEGYTFSALLTQKYGRLHIFCITDTEILKVIGFIYISDDQ